EGSAALHVGRENSDAVRSGERHAAADMRHQAAELGRKIEREHHVSSRRVIEAMNLRPDLVHPIERLFLRRPERPFTERASGRVNASYLHRSLLCLCHCSRLVLLSASTAMIRIPVITLRKPGSTWNTFSIESSRNKKSEALQVPMTLAWPPATLVPPITTTAMELSRNSLPMLSEGPPTKPAKSTPASEVKVLQRIEAATRGRRNAT